MIKYLKSLWMKIKQASLKFKIFLCFVLLVYLSIVSLCLVKIDVDCTTPGIVTSVASVIDVETDKNDGHFFTVSVYSRYRVSLMQYLFTQLDENSKISRGKQASLDGFTTNEEYITNAAYKQQSLQDAIILAYETAKKHGYDVELNYQYRGQYLLNIPQALFKTGPSDILNGDIITKMDDFELASEEDYLQKIESICEQILIDGEKLTDAYKNGKYDFNNSDLEISEIKNNINKMLAVINSQDYTNSVMFTILRNDKEIVITPSLKMVVYLYTRLFKSDKYFFHNQTNTFVSYDIDFDNAKPKCSIGTSYSVGPSGGLIQALSVYNAIVSDKFVNGRIIMGTGGIKTDGTVTIIGGEQQKIITANIYYADVFFIPQDNYQSAKEMYDKIKKPKFELVAVNTFEEAVNYLRGEN